MHPLKELSPYPHPPKSPPQNLWIQMMHGGLLKKFYRRIRRQAGLSRSGSVGDVTLWPEPSGVMTLGGLVLCRETSEQTQVAPFGIRDQPTRDTDTTAGAVGEETLLNIPPCSMAEEPGEQSQSLFCPPMSDPELDLER